MRHVYYIKFAYLLLYIKYTVISITKLNIYWFKTYMYERDHVWGLKYFCMKENICVGIKIFCMQEIYMWDAFVKISVCMLIRLYDLMVQSLVVQSWGAQWLSGRVLDLRPRV